MDSAGAKLDRFEITGRLILCGQLCADGEAAAGVLMRHFAQRSTAKATARCEQGKRLQHIGFARAVFAHQKVELPGAVDAAGPVVAKSRKGDPVERHLSAVVSRHCANRPRKSLILYIGDFPQHKAFICGQG